MSTDRDYDNSCSQYGVLGIWALERIGLEVSDDYWKAVETAWKKDQLPDGRWTYISKSGEKDVPFRQIDMTAAGIATLFIAQDYLHSQDGLRCTGNIKNPTIDKAMKWIETNLPNMVSQVNLYGWYGIERIGVASGYKYFG